MKKEIFVYPAKKTRRMLVTLSDIFITFILSVFLYEIVVLSISKPIIKYNDIQEEMYTNEVLSRDLLIENNLLKKSEKEYDFSSDLEETAINYIKFYVFDEEAYKDNDYLYNYFVKLGNENLDYLNNLLITKCPTFFDIEQKTILNTYAFKENIKNSLRPYFIEGDELSKEQQALFDEFKETRFLTLYEPLINHIKNNNEIVDSNGKTYSFYVSNISKLEDKIKYNNLICTFISFGISVIVLYFVIPLCNHKGRTLSEMILKVERVDFKTIQYLKKRYKLLEGLINFFESLVLVMFIPFIELGISGIFSFPILYTLSLCSLAFILIQLILLIANKYAKTLKELSTFSICVDTSTIDEYYKEIYSI